jgi:hypothetical protein
MQTGGIGEKGICKEWQDAMERHRHSEPQNIINFTSHRRRKTATHFTRAELNQLLGLYGEKSRTGEWRHSTLDQRYGLIAYSIFNSPLERPIFAVVKCERAHREKGRYILFAGKKRVKQSTNLAEILFALRAMRPAH